MNKSRLLCTISAFIFPAFVLVSGAVRAVVLDSGTHTVDYVITDGLVAAATVSIEDGADISGLGDTTYGAIENYGTLNIHGGFVRGRIYNRSNSLNVTGGSIESIYFPSAHEVTISGGYIGLIESEGGSQVDITGGTIDEIYTFFGSTYNISGGLFPGRIMIGIPGDATMNISGGEFSGEFVYYPDDDTNNLTTKFTFFGDLSLSTPLQNGSGGYETTISGTLMDGNTISQRITCYDSRVAAPCSLIDIIDMPITKMVSIDIKPGKDSYTVNLKSGGFIPVAVLTEGEFDALQVDPDTVKFGPSEATATSYRVKDVDRDGDMDLFMKFRIKQTGIACADTLATLTGELYDGTVITGTDSIQTKTCP